MPKSHPPYPAEYRARMVGLHLGVGAIAVWLGGLAGAALGLLAAWSFHLEQRNRGLLLSRPLPAHAASAAICRRVRTRCP